MGTKAIIEKYVNLWEQKGYKNGIPDEAPIQLEKRGLVPSYRLICMVLMRNPYNLEKLGFTRKKCTIYKEIKRSELIERGVIVPDNQLKLNFYEKDRK